MFGLFYMISELLNRLIIGREERIATSDSYRNALNKNKDTYYDSKSKCFKTVENNEICMTVYDVEKNGKVYLINPTNMKVIKEYNVGKPRINHNEEVKKLNMFLDSLEDK